MKAVNERTASYLSGISTDSRTLDIEANSRFATDMVVACTRMLSGGKQDIFSSHRAQKKGGHVTTSGFFSSCPVGHVLCPMAKTGHIMRTSFLGVWVAVQWAE